MKLRIVLVFSIMFIFLRYIAFSQEKPDNKIQYLVLKDKFLIKEIKKLIVDEINSNDSNQFFKKGLGYVRLNVYNYSHNDTLIKYYITPTMTSFKKDDNDDLYPLFYTYINERIVLIYLNVVNEFSIFNLSKKSKTRFRKKVEIFLPETKKMTFYDMEGKKTFTDKNFRIDYFKFHGGKYIYILKDKPPIVINE